MSGILPEKVDARTLWIPLSVAFIFFFGSAATLVGVTVWLTNLSHDAKAGTNLAAQIEGLNSSQNRLEGKIDTLVGMQGDLARTSAELSGLKSRIDAQDRRLEGMDAWIQTTRDRLRAEGLHPPDYRPGGTP